MSYAKAAHAYRMIDVHPDRETAQLQLEGLSMAPGFLGGRVTSLQGLTKNPAWAVAADFEQHMGRFLWGSERDLPDNVKIIPSVVAMSEVAR